MNKRMKIEEFARIASSRSQVKKLLRDLAPGEALELTIDHLPLEDQQALLSDLEEIAKANGIPFVNNETKH